MLTIEDAKAWTMCEAEHHNGGKVFFAYTHRCEQQPRLSRYDRYDKATKTVASTWRVDGLAQVDLSVAIDALNRPPVTSEGESLVLATITDEPADRRKEMIADYEIWSRLREKGLIQWDAGRVTITEAGRAALASKGISDV